MLAAWLVCASAALATPVELPAGEDSAAWRTALGLSGLEPGRVAAGAGVRLLVQGEELVIWVRDVQGAEHRVTVARPRTAQERESITALAASLVQPIRSASLPGLPGLELPAPAPRPRPVPRPAPAPAPVEVVQVHPVLVVEPEPEVALVEEPPLPAPAPRRPELPALQSSPPPPMERPPHLPWRPPFVTLGPSLRMRPTLRSTAALGATLGLARGPLSVAVGVEGVLPARLLKVDGDHGMVVVDARLLPAWAYRRWELGPALSLSWRKVLDPIEPPPGALLPTAGLQMSRSWTFGDLGVRLSLLVEGDLVESSVVRGPDIVKVQPISAGLGTSVVFGR
jgi:hypothetical protein